MVYIPPQGFPRAGISWSEVKYKLETEGSLNKRYDSDLDGVIDSAAIPDLSRSKIIDFFGTPFWDNIPDKPRPEPEILIATEDTPEELKRIADVVCQRNPVLITECEEPWTPENANVTTDVSTDRVSGNYSAQINVGNFLGTGAIASYSFPSLDLSGKDGIRLWVKIVNGGSSNIDSGYIQVKLLDSAGNVIETYNLNTGLITTNETMDWRLFELVFSDPSLFTDVAKIQLYKKDYLARNFTIYVDLIEAVEWRDHQVISDKLEELKGGGVIKLLKGTYKLIEPIRNATVGDFFVTIEGQGVLHQLKGDGYFYLDSARHITLRNLRAVGGRSIHLSDANNFRMFNCYVEGVILGSSDNLLLVCNTFDSKTTTPFYIITSDNVSLIGNYMNVDYFDLGEGCRNCIVVGNIFTRNGRIGRISNVIFTNNIFLGILSDTPVSDSLIAGNIIGTLIISHPSKGSGANVRYLNNVIGSYDLSKAGHYIEIDFGNGYNFFRYDMSVYS